MVRLRVVFYNLRVGRSQRRVAAELLALALVFRPKLLAGCEAVGYRLPRIPGYVLIRDTSTPGRANLFAYVRANRHLGKVRWFDTDATWERTEHPGIHPARAYLELVVEGVMFLVGHHAPRTRQGPGSSTLARLQGDAVVRDRLAPEHRAGFEARPEAQQQRLRWRPEVAVLDWNAGPGATIGPAAVAQHVGGRPAGERIDAGVVRNAELRNVRYPHRAGVLQLLSDHEEALVLDVAVDRRWWPAA